jgi:hypothetical protein
MKKQLEAFIRDPSNTEARAALASAIGGDACLVLETDGKISVQKSLDCKEFLEDLGQPRAVSGRYKGALTLSEFLDRGKRRLLCDPSTPENVALDRDGISQDDAAINWGGVPEERLVLVRLGRELGRLSNRPDPDRRRDWSEALRAKTLADPWVSITQEWTKLTPAERDALKDSLIYRSVRDHRVKSVQMEEVLPPLPPPPISPTSKVKVVLLCATDDANYVAEFRMHAKGLEGIADIWDVRDVRPGALTQLFLADQFKTAQVFLHFLSASYLSTSYPANVEMFATARHIPILLRPCILPDNSYLATKRGLPYTNKFIVSERDRDSAWSDVVTGLRAVLQKL